MARSIPEEPASVPWPSVPDDGRLLNLSIGSLRGPKLAGRRQNAVASVNFPAQGSMGLVKLHLHVRTNTHS